MLTVHRNLEKIILLFLLILAFYQPVKSQIAIQTDTVIQTSTCGGANVLIPFTVTGGQVPFGTVFTAELSNAFGQFNDPVEMGSFPWIGVGFMIGQIPEDQGLGFFYRIRVVSQALGVIGSESPNIVIVTSIPQLANISIDPGDSTCDDPILLETGPASEYRWNTGETTQSIEATASGTYTVTLTDLIGCEIKSDPVELIVGESPDVPDIEFIGLELEATEAHAYQWFLDGDTIEEANSQQYVPIAPGDYQVEVYSPEGCKEISEIFSVPAQNEIQVYPVPTAGDLTIETGLLLNENFSYTLYDYNGAVLKKKKHELYSGYLRDEMDISDLPEGDYILLIFWKQQVLKYHIFKSNED